MKIAPFFVLLLFPLIVLGRDTPRESAYKALRVIGVERDQTLLHRVLEVRGRNGTPQPEKWVIVLDDPLARGGVREIEVADRRIVSERTPVKAYSGSAEGLVMNFHRLNLDSEGAFTIAEDQARAAKLGFDAVDYLLRCDDSNSAPTWVLQMLDYKQRTIGSISIAADTGAVISKDFGAARSGSTGPAIPSNPSRGTAPAENDSATDEKFAPMQEFGNRVDRAVHQFGANLEEFFTGRRTLDRRYRGDEEQ